MGLSDVILDHFLHPRNAAPLATASGEGWSGSVEDGRYMRVQVRIQDGLLMESSFGTWGCAPAIAAGSLLTEWATGRPVAEIRRATAGWLEERLGGLPDGRRFCAQLAIEAMNAALDNAGWRGG